MAQAISARTAPPIGDLRQPLIEGGPKDVQADWRQHGLIQVIYRIIVLAPKYIGFGIGWTLGFMWGGPAGAGVGAATGAFIGSMLSLAIEVLVGKYGGFDKQLQTMALSTIFTQRCKSALVFSCGCLFAGFSLHWCANLLTGGGWAAVGSGVITYVGVAISYVLGAMAARALMELGDSCRGIPSVNQGLWKNLRKDFTVALGLIGPAAVAFAILHPVLWTSGSSLLHTHTWQVAWESDKAMLIGVAPGVFLNGCVDAIWNYCRNKRHLKADPSVIQPGSQIQAQDSAQQQSAWCDPKDRYPDYAAAPLKDGAPSVNPDAVLAEDVQNEADGAPSVNADAVVAGDVQNEADGGEDQALPHSFSNKCIMPYPGQVALEAAFL